MDKFAALKAFTAVVEQGGFAVAARASGQSRSAVNRMVIDLENEFGVQLLNRTTRKVSPTANGQAYYDRAKAILAELTDAEQALVQDQAQASGHLRVNAPMSFGTMHLGSAISDFMRRHSGLTVELHLNDRLVNIIEEGFDLSIRIAEPEEESSMVDFRICEARRVVCAAPGYIAEYGAPSTPAELKHRACLHYGNLPSGSLWRLIGPRGAIGVHVNSVLCSNNAEILRDGAVRGLGIALLPTFIAGAELQAGRLVTLLNGYRSPELVLSVVYPATRHLSVKVRLLTDFLMERFGSRPYWDLVD